MSAPAVPTLFVTDWTPSPTVIAGCALAAGLYLGAAYRTPRWPRNRTAAFLAGVLVILVALDSGLDTYEVQLLSVHMVQHILLLDLAPPLLLTGRPIVLLLRWLPPRPRRSFGRGLVALGRGAHPLLCLALYTVILLAIHVPAVFDATLRSQPLHELEHGAFLLAGLIVWWPLLGRPGPRRRLGAVAHLLYITAAMVPMTLIGAYLDRATTLFYPPYAGPARALGISAVADQQQAGAIMWVAGTAVMALLGVVAVLAAMLEAERRQRVRDLRGVVQ